MTDRPLYNVDASGGACCCRVRRRIKAGSAGSAVIALRLCAFACGLLCLIGSATAQPQVTLAPAKVGVVPNLIPVAVGPAYAAALSETHGLLAFALDRTAADGHLCLVKLDAKGNPAAYRKSWKLPKPVEALAKAGTYPLSVAFHPKLPLLYVWQDVNLYYGTPATSHPPEWKQFDHLLIYSFAKDPPELLVSLCRGEDAMYGMQGGMLAVDQAGEYLYVPNLRDKSAWIHFGRFRLDADGLPIADDADVKLPAAARIKKLAERNITKGVTPVQQTPVEYQYLHQMGPFGTGHSFHILAKDVILSAGQTGVMTWRPEDTQAAVQGMPLKTTGNHPIGIHPSLPFLFATGGNTDSLFRIAHSEGNLSLLPLQITLPQTRLFSAPVIFDKGSRVAVGGNYHVYVVPIDAKCEPQPAVTKVPVLAAAARAMVYSDRFDRLYVGVEVSK
jgi:hypothetical protein